MKEHLLYRKTITNTDVNIFGDVVSKIVDTRTIVKKSVTRKQGMSLVKKIDVFGVLPQIIKSQKDAEIVSFLVKNQGVHGYVTVNGVMPTMKVFENIFGVTRAKVSEIISRMIKVDMLKKNKRELHINPFMVLPFGSSDSMNNITQLRWECDFKISREELEFVDKQMQDEVIIEVSKPKNIKKD